MALSASVSGKIRPEMDLLYADTIGSDLFHLPSLISLSYFPFHISSFIAVQHIDATDMRSYQPDLADI